MPILESGDPTGPIENGITYIVRPVLLFTLLFYLFAIIEFKKQEKPFMQLGKRSWMACWRESGDIQLPNCPLTPSFPLGTASWRFEVTTKVRLSTRATSTGSVRANQLQIYNDVRENDK